MALDLAEPPRPRGVPLLGNLPQLLRHGAIDFFTEQWRALGDTFALRAGSRRMVIVAHPESVAHVLARRAENYPKGPSYDDLRVLTGGGLLTLEGDVWRRRRRLAQPSFHRASIDRLVHNMVTVTQRALTRWRALHPRGGVIDAHDEMMRLTLDIVAETLFGQALSEAATDTSVSAFTEVLRIVSDRGNAPVRLPIAVPTLDNLRLKRALRQLDATTYELIARARAHGDQTSLLSMLLAARDPETGEGLSQQELRNEVITLLLAGHETTALALSWGFELLRDAPEVVARMRAEVRQVLGDRPPSAADTPRLTYLRQVIDEILRLRSPVWTVARDAQQDDSLGGFRIRAGDTVFPCTYLTHRHPEFWQNPERFDPERFTPERVRTREQWAYYPFSLGQRMCIGNVFSLVEAQVVLALLLQHCDFGPATSRRVRPDAGFTLRPSEPIRIRIAWRS